MLIEYKIKFEKSGLTITQRVEPDDTNGAEPEVSEKASEKAQAPGGKSLGASFKAPPVGGGGNVPGLPPGGGGGGTEDAGPPGGGGPGGKKAIIIFGPVVIVE